MELLEYSVYVKTRILRMYEIYLSELIHYSRKNPSSHQIMLFAMCRNFVVSSTY